MGVFAPVSSACRCHSERSSRSPIAVSQTDAPREFSRQYYVEVADRVRAKNRKVTSSARVSGGPPWSAARFFARSLVTRLPAAISGPTKKLSYLAMRIASSRSSSAVNVFFSACRFNKIVSRSLSRTISPGTSAPSMLYVNLYLEGHGPSNERSGHVRIFRCEIARFVNKRRASRRRRPNTLQEIVALGCTENDEDA